ncbi:hypothetical protein AAFF_G00204900 [Aldrovandia affinis]|uniref:Uncharacterized protein n=1 Tax=Aldrovandia affinis TaxID=143900 RepID=A0AAD7RHT3_9TELE|nr:hypothetical protein AAFF_G00204900 [Aldrovandia affinis]
MTSLKQPCAVRWLSLHRAVEGIKRNWPALVIELNEEAVGGNAQAQGILGQIQPYCFIALTHALADVLPVMTKLNLVFQKDDVNLATIRPMVHASVAALTQLRDAPGPEEERFQADCQEGMYKDVKVTHAALQEYAEPAIRTIIGHFGKEITSEDESAPATAPLIDATSAQRDAIAVMTALRSYGGLNFSTACEVLIRDFSEIYPEWAKLAKFIISISHGIKIDFYDKFESASFQDGADSEGTEQECLFNALLFLVTRLTALKVEIISSNQDIEVGVRHILLCKGSNEGLMTWLKNGEEIDPDEITIDVVDETSSKLIIEKSKILDSGLYTCHFVPDTGSEKEVSYQLYVFQRPTFPNTPVYHEFLEGQDAVIPCAATALPSLDVKWRKVTDGRGLAITAAASGFLCERVTMLDDNSLQITAIERKHHGTYVCEAAIKGRPISEQLSISVVVNAPPTVEIHKAQENVVAGSRTNVSIACLVIGVPFPNITWTSPPSSDATRYKFNSDKSELTIPSVVRSDFGEYTCVATNKIGESRATFVLDVSEHPIVSLSQAVMEVEPGQNASVTCEGSGHPPPKIQWVRKNANVELNSNSSLVKLVGHTLEFKAVEASDGGLYTCIGLNAAGNDTKDFSLKTWPGTPSKISVSPGPSSAHFSLDRPLVDGGSPITQYVLQWRQEGERNWSQRVIHSTEPLVITSLKPYTSYLIQFAVKNRLGQGGFSTPHSIQTLAKREPDSPILMVNEVQVEKDSFSIPIKQLDDGGSPILHYTIRYRRDMEGENWKQMQLPSNTTRIHIEGLHYNASYHLEVTAINPNGSSRPTSFTFGVPWPAPVTQPSKMGKGGVVAIVMFIFLVLLIAVDVTCCYTNHCGLLMFLAVKLLGQNAPGVKTLEEGDGDITTVDVKLNGLSTQSRSIPKQQQQNGAQNGVQSEVTCDKAPLTKFEKAPPSSDPAAEA